MIAGNEFITEIFFISFIKILLNFTAADKPEKHQINSDLNDKDSECMEINSMIDDKFSNKIGIYLDKTTTMT